MTQLNWPQCAYCGNTARTRRARLCLPCLEERFKKALRAWQDGWSRPLAAERAGLTEQEFLYQLDRREIRLRDIPHKRTRRRRRWKNSPETIARQTAARQAKVIAAFVNAPLPITKQCNACKAIKPRDDFYVFPGRAVDTDGRRSKVLSYTCKVCTRERVRKRQANLTDEQREHRNAVRREWENFRAQELREQEGRERRCLRHPLAKKSQAYQSDVKLPLGPFQEWIRDRCEHYVATHEPEDVAQNEGYIAGLSHLAHACQVSQRTLRRFLDGYEIVGHGKQRGNRRELPGIPLQTVDSCLTNEGSTFLFELYPADMPLVGELAVA